jgi:two-component system NtrC family sensor kinase
VTGDSKRFPQFASSTGFRLTVGFLGITLLFIITTSLAFLNNLKKFDSSTAEITEAKEGLKASLNMAYYIQKKHEIRTQAMWTGDLSVLEQIDAVKVVKYDWENAVQSGIKTEEERVWLKEFNRLDQEADTYFDTTVLAAVKRKDAAAVKELSQRYQQIYQHLDDLVNSLITTLARKTTLAQIQAEGIRDRAIRETVVLIGGAVLVALLVGWYVSRSVVGPTQKLIKETEHIAEGDLTRTIDLGRADEFGQLAESFNAMTARLYEHQQQLIRSERLAALGRLAAGVAHEINNPIGVILGYLEVILSKETLDSAHREDLKIIEEEALQCKRVVESLLNLSRTTSSRKQAVDVHEEIEDVVRRFETIGVSENIRIVKDIEDVPMMVYGDQEKLKDVFFNIIHNGIEAMPDGGTLSLKGYISPDMTAKGEDGLGGNVSREEVVLEFVDTGCGIPEEHQQRVFEPFFTTKAKGTGLGLAISDGIVKAHNGTLALKSTVGHGTRVILTLPLINDQSAEGSLE